MATAAHAGEPWPENSVTRLPAMNGLTFKHYGGDPVKLALARNNLLHMLRNHYETAKEAGGVAATRQDGGGGGWEPGQIIEFSKPPTTHCTTMSLGGGLSSTDCE
jgi:hypothetical protein